MSVSVDFTSTQRTQWRASNPAASAWVVANAGSGKTHVLTQRVVRLLLDGADPAAILCLTFTKVGAAEMSRRIFETLGRWTTLPAEKLAREINEAQGRPPSAAEIVAARRLFARALETPGGLKIQTIHAFSEKLLHQFPFEANVPGHFAVLDETAAAALLAQSRAAVLAAAAGAPESRLGKAVRYLAEHATDAQIKAALDAVIAKREPLRAWMAQTGEVGEAGGIDDALEDLRDKLGLEPGETVDALCGSICNAAKWAGVDCQELTDALEQAASTNSYDNAARAALADILHAADPVEETLARVSFFVIWKDGAYAARGVAQRFGSAFRKSRIGLDDDFSAEADRLIALAAKLNAARTLAATEALLVVGDAILNEYALAKRYAGQLDFGDLIVKTRNLLSRSDAAAWVLYKLDARIDHILVDEAQDTSPDQWAIVRALAADFFSGEGARGERTIFVVGDDKQSIFSFQGAAPRMLSEMESFFKKLVGDAGREFERVPLALSFRSTSEVLSGVDAVFAGDLRDRVTASGYEIHAAHRLNEPGRVVVLPRRVRAKSEEPDDWTEPYDAPTAADKALADDVVGEIKALLETRLPSGKLVKPGGILVLVGKRDAFFTAVNRSLRDARIPTAGADRLPVATHIAVLDLLALADVTLLPDDDLQLAACLKSPLIGLTEEELMHLAAGRGRKSLWRALRDSEAPRVVEAAQKLRGWLAGADQVTPFRFFAEILGPQGGRRAFRERLGSEADDVLDAFLSQALSYENLGPPTLQGFSAFIRASEGDIKRESEEAGAGVRVMTVHGAKGLEADVVFLVDSGSRIIVHQHRDCLVDVGDGNGPAFLWRRASAESTQLQRDADSIADEETQREYLRLLYVGMTRARDVLYVCGIRPNTREVEGCWYGRVRDALVPAELERDPENGELLAPYAWPQPPREPLAAKEVNQPAADRPAVASPDWLVKPAPSPEPAPRPLRPSRGLAEPDIPAEPAAHPARTAARRAAPTAPPWDATAGSSAQAAAHSLSGGDARLRGNAIHRLLQTLPGIASTDRRAAAERLLASLLPADSPEAKAALAEAEAVLSHPELAEIFGPDSRAEVPIVGHIRLDGSPEKHAVSGQIDRLLCTDRGWQVFDFKTNRTVPETLDQVDPAYILQLALYRKLLREIGPTGEVAAAIVWTAGPKLMPIPAERMEQALAKLAARAKSVP
jgi:ATP-dependent helicase/nuclease subunit A